MLNNKYNLGDYIMHFTGIGGMVTAVHIRDSGFTYEMTYLHDGVPSSVICEEFELEPSQQSEWGFGVSKKKA